VPSGFALTAAAAANLVSAHLEHCEGDCEGLDPERFPLRRMQMGAGLRLGADWRWFGFGAGALTNYRLEAPGQYELARDLPLWPDVLLRFGRRDVLHVDLGLGAYDASTVLRPGLFAGVGVVPVEDWHILAHFGMHQPGAFGNAVLRADLAVRRGLGQGMEVGMGVAWTHDPDYPGNGTGFDGRGLVALEL
jgi:hypothetical protein